jgi:protein ImuA
LQLHPDLWRAHQLAWQAQAVCPSGHAALDAQLPGGGWPQRALTELLLPHLGVGEMRLLAPVLAAVQAQGRLVMLFDPPERLSPWALAGLGLQAGQLLLIQTQPLGVEAGQTARRAHRSAGKPSPQATQSARVPQAVHGSQRLWALEQALRSGHVGAVLAWLPTPLPAACVRRLQLAAQAHEGPAFVFREAGVATQPSAAPLRVALRVAGPDALELRVLKRRGPALDAPLTLALPAVLGAHARRRALQRSAPGVGAGVGTGVGAGGGAGWGAGGRDARRALPAATFVQWA